MKTTLTILLFAWCALGISQGTKNPLIYYKLDNQTYHTDVSGNGYNATLRGDGIGYDPIIGGYSFSGTNDYLVVPTVDLGTHFTFSFWAHTTQEVPVRSMLVFMGGGTLFLDVDISSNKLNVRTTGSNNTSGYTWTLNTWHHVVVEIDKTNSKARLFLDGNYPHTLTDSTISNNFVSNDSLYIGVGAAKTYDFSGNIDEFMVFKNLTVTSAVLDSLYSSDDPLQTYFPKKGQHVRIKKGGIELKDKADPYGSVYFRAKQFYVNTIPQNGINRQILTTDYNGVCPEGASREDDYDCAINDFDYAPLRALKNYEDVMTTVYIDPTWSGTQSGTISEPYVTFPTWAANTRYLLKRGTTLTHSVKFTVDVDGVFIGAYGTGSMPIISSTTNIYNFVLTGDNTTIRDISVRNPQYSAATTANFQVTGSNNNDFYNLDVRYGSMGFRMTTGTTGNRIIGCRLHNLYFDGVYALSPNYLEISHTKIYNVNEAYQVNTDMAYSNGDGIQVSRSTDASIWKEVWIHHDSIDRREEANKADIMLVTGGSYVPEDAIIEYNYLVAPKTDASGAQVINANGTYRKIIKGNVISGKYWNTFGLYSTSPYDTVINNVFTGLRVAIQGGANGTFINNTFYDNDTCIYRSVSAVANNITNNIFYNNRNNLVNVSATNYLTNFLSNPSFVNPTSGNFHLLSTSEAIDQGTTISYTAKDIEGTERTSGAYDIGAYEYK